MYIRDIKKHKKQFKILFYFIKFKYIKRFTIKSLFTKYSKCKTKDVNIDDNNKLIFDNELSIY